MGAGEWSLSWRSDPRAVALYDRHYSRRPSSVGALNVAPPGWVLVLVHSTLAALWVVSRQRDEWVKHAWVGAWRCTVFRYEKDATGGGQASCLIREAVASTCAAWGPIPAAGLVTEVDPTKVRKKRDPGRCFLRAGFRRVGETKRGLVVLRLSPCPQPAPVKCDSMNLSLFGR